MRVHLLPFPLLPGLLLRLAALGLGLALINAVPALAATTTSTPSITFGTNSVSNPIATPVATPAPKKSDDDDTGVDDHSFKLNINTGHDDKPDKPESVMSEFFDNLIPIFAIAASFGTPIIIVFFVCYFSFRRRRENVALAREYLEKGLPVPPELLDPNHNAWQYGRSGQGSGGISHDLRRGFRLTFIGLAVTVALFVDNPHSTTWGWGLIPTIMGLGFLLSGWFETRRADKSGFPLDRQFPPGDPR